MARTAERSNLSLQELEQLLARRRKDVDRLRRRRDSLMARVSAIDAQIAELGGAAGGGMRARNERPLADVIHDVLGKAGKSMRVSDIADAVRSTGYRSNSPNFRSIVNQMLIKDKRFASAGRSFYQLKK